MHYHIGQRLRTKVADCDTDDEGNLRGIPVGSEGTIVEMNDPPGYHSISWDSGAWTVWTDEEIARDATLLGDADAPS